MRQCNTCARRSNLAKKIKDSAYLYLSRNVPADASVHSQIITTAAVRHPFKEANPHTEMRLTRTRDCLFLATRNKSNRRHGSH
jgi:hypothetical protein